MLDAAEIAADKALLSEFAEIAMDLARDLHASAKAAEDPEVKAKLAQEFHRIGRGLRPTLALKGRRARLSAREAFEAVRRERDGAKDAVAQRKVKVRAAVERLIWSEYEGDDAQEASDELDDHLARVSTDEDFLSAPIETLVARLAGKMGIPAHPRAGGDPSRGPDDSPDDLTFDASG